MTTQTQELRNLLQALAANQEPTQPSLDSLRRLANNAVDPGVDGGEAASSFLEATLKGGSLSAARLLALPPDEALRITHFRLWQHGAQLARTARRHVRDRERTIDDHVEPTDIETEVRRQHDAPLVARDLKRELGPDLLRLLRFRLQGLGFAAIAEHEQVGLATVHSRVQQALERLRAHAKRTRTSEETGRLALLLIAS